MRYSRNRHVRGTTWGLPEMKGSTYERWRPTGGGAVQVDGCSAPRQVGVEKRVQRESEVASKGEIWGSDRSKVQGEKMKIHNMVETGGKGGGYNKVVSKKQSLRLQQYPTEAENPPPHNSVILPSPETGSHTHAHTIKQCKTHN